MAIAFRVTNADEVAEALAANECFSLILAGHFGKRELPDDHDFYTQPYAFLRNRPKKGCGLLVFTCAVPWMDEEAFQGARLKLARDYDWLPVREAQLGDSPECFEYGHNGHDVKEEDNLTFTDGGYYPGSFPCTKQSKDDLEAAAVRITCAACRWDINKSWREHRDAVVETFRAADQTSSMEVGHGSNKRPRIEGDALDILAKVVSVEDGRGQGSEGGFLRAYDERRIGSSPPPYQRNPTYHYPNTPNRNIQGFRSAGENCLVLDEIDDARTYADDQFYDNDQWNDGFADCEERMDWTHEEYGAHDYFPTPRRSERPPIVRHTPPSVVRPVPVLPPSRPPGLDGEQTVPALPRLPDGDAQGAAGERDGDLPSNRQPAEATVVEDLSGGATHDI